jgi:SAM-dependent methyltransferase
MGSKTETIISGIDYWDSIGTRSNVKHSEDLWRAHLRELYQELKDRWNQQSRCELTLKTDLHDEAISNHNLISVFGSDSDQIVGTDLSFVTALAAKNRMEAEWRGDHEIVVSDARKHAFGSNIFDRIISNSTLDHFSDKKDIFQSLRELQRIMKPGGTLMITLDNPWNPAVFLRNRLPYRWLKSLGVIPFYMGVTLSRPELIHALESNGFSVCDSTAIVHRPRILAIRIGNILGKVGHGRTRVYFHRILKTFECLEGLPTKYVTGYFVAVKAVKRTFNAVRC